MFSKLSGVILFSLLLQPAIEAQQPMLSGAEIAGGWILLWDGESTFGWETALNAQWTATAGVLRESAGGFVWLRHKAPFADLVLELDFKMLTEDADSGIFLRAAAEGDPSRTGYQVNINNRNEEYGTGSLVFRVKYSGSKVAVGEWHHYTITAEKDRIVAVLDGKKTLDVRDSTSASGYIGLQFVKPDEVEFRNIRLKPLGLRPLFNGTDLSGWERVDRPNVKEPPAAIAC